MNLFDEEKWLRKEEGDFDDRLAVVGESRTESNSSGERFRSASEGFRNSKLLSIDVVAWGPRSSCCWQWMFTCIGSVTLAKVVSWSYTRSPLEQTNVRVKDEISQLTAHIGWSSCWCTWPSVLVVAPETSSDVAVTVAIGFSSANSDCWCKLRWTFGTRHSPTHRRHWCQNLGISVGYLDCRGSVRSRDTRIRRHWWYLNYLHRAFRRPFSNGRAWTPFLSYPKDQHFTDWVPLHSSTLLASRRLINRKNSSNSIAPDRSRSALEWSPPSKVRKSTDCRPSLKKMVDICCLLMFVK